MLKFYKAETLTRETVRVWSENETLAREVIEGACKGFKEERRVTIESLNEIPRQEKALRETVASDAG